MIGLIKKTMDPITLTTLGVAGANILSSIWNTSSQEKTNAYNVQAQKDINAQNQAYDNWWQYQKRNWALEDWNRQNAYNAPAQVMQRLKEAGLNPNLVYGSGGAQTPAGMVRSSEGANAHLQAPQKNAPQFQIPDFSGMLSQIYDIKARRTQVENMEVQNRLLKQQEVTNQLNQAGIAIKNARGDFELRKANALYDTALERAKLNNELTGADIAYKNRLTEYVPKNYELQKAAVQIQKQNSAASIQKILSETALNQYKLKHNLPLEIVQAQAAIRSKNIQNLLYSQSLEILKQKSNWSVDNLQELMQVILSTLELGSSLPKGGRPRIGF